jgi:hypothetical protein
MNAISLNNRKIGATLVERTGALVFGIHYSELRRTVKVKRRSSRKQRRAHPGQKELGI